MALRISEIYPSFQGEGPNTGKPTTFVRFAGCNLKCAGWPCDTPHAIDPKIFTKEQKIYTDPWELAMEIGQFSTTNICFTGGEAFIQSIDDLESLLRWIEQIHTPKCSLEVFTNGTRSIPTAVRRKFNTIVLDWKLPGSDELIGGAYGPDSNLWRNIRALGPGDAIKFTIKDRKDYVVAKERYNLLQRQDSIGGVVYCGVVWGALDTSELASWILEDQLPWHLNVQTHKYVWHPDARRT
jgi:7-carboxy-7-deazaguanine synthase